MKILLIFLFQFCYVFFTYSQELLIPQVELFFITEGVPFDEPKITCTITAQSKCWGNIIGTYPPQTTHYFLTNDYDEQTYIPTHNNMGQASSGFDFVTSQDAGQPVISYGLYKIISDSTNKYFYLDYRDYRIGFYNYYLPPSYGNDHDLWIKYRYSLNRLEYSTNSIDYIEITNGQLLNFWDIKQKGTPYTSLFPDYVP